MTATLTPTRPRREDRPLKDTSYAEGTTLGPHVEEFFACKVEDGELSPSSVPNYRYPLAAMARALPDHQLTDVTLDELRALRRTFPSGSRYFITNVFRSFWSWMEQEERVIVNPASRLKAGRRNKEIRTLIFADAEIDVLERLPDLRDRALMALLFDSGIRMGEARALQLLHVNVAERYLTVVSGKGGKGRTIPLGRSVAPLNDLYRLDGLDPTDFLWYGFKAGTGKRGSNREATRHKQIDTTRFYRWWRECLNTARIVYRNPHTTRHSFASRWLRDGGNVAILSRLMGHASIATTVDAYGHLMLEDMQAEVERLEALRA